MQEIQSIFCGVTVVGLVRARGSINASTRRRVFLPNLNSAIEHSGEDCRFSLPHPGSFRQHDHSTQRQTSAYDNINILPAICDIR